VADLAYSRATQLVLAANVEDAAIDAHYLPLLYSLCLLIEQLASISMSVVAAKACAADLQLLLADIAVLQPRSRDILAARLALDALHLTLNTMPSPDSSIRFNSMAETTRTRNGVA
jgi:hypothetical protein